MPSDNRGGVDATASSSARFSSRSMVSVGSEGTSIRAGSQYADAAKNGSGTRAAGTAPGGGPASTTQEKNESATKRSTSGGGVRRLGMKSMRQQGLLSDSEDEHVSFFAIVKKNWIGFCRFFSNNNTFAVVMTLLTFYALVGDDLRLALTEKQHDPIFNGMTYASILIFSFEVLVYTWGKADYYGGFFFYLDIVSTLSLVLDITTLAEELFTSPEDEGGGGQGGGGVARVGRASRMGTRMGRVVRVIRVIRLVRIFKLYKAHLERKRKREREQQNMLLPPGERQVFSDAAVDDEEHEVEESRVGKKLSEMTTRRVILVVLVMLIAVPLFRSDGLLSTKDLYMDAASYSVNSIWDSFRRYLIEVKKVHIAGASATEAEIRRRDAERNAYERKHLHFLYYHNWHGTYDSGSGYSVNPHSVKDRVFWVGFFFQPSANAEWQEIAEHATLGNSSYYNDSAHWALPSGTWDAKYRASRQPSASVDGVYESNAIPDEFKENLKQVWNGNCEEKVDLFFQSYIRRRYGASIAHPQDKRCPKDLRYNEIGLVAPMICESEACGRDTDDVFLRQQYPELESMVFVWYFDLTPWTSLEAVFNMFQTFFVLLLLLVGSMLFAKDANKLVLYPVERMITRLSKIRSNPFEAIRMSEEELRRDAEMNNKGKTGMITGTGSASSSTAGATGNTSGPISSKEKRAQIAGGDEPLLDHKSPSFVQQTNIQRLATIRKNPSDVRHHTSQSSRFDRSSSGQVLDAGVDKSAGVEGPMVSSTTNNASVSTTGANKASGRRSNRQEGGSSLSNFFLIRWILKIKHALVAFWNDDPGSSKLMETVILEKTIIKLGGLCALAFGEAGSAVIGHNMKDSDTTSAINTMVDGQYMDAIFGFCDIRNFTDATEILQDGVMLFVNRISEIVHTVTDAHCGSPNKNIGDAFLLVWRLGYITKSSDISYEELHRGEACRISELAVMCFSRIIAATNRSPVLATYRLHEGLLNRMPNYRVKMGFGLHRGWAIEGAIGSEFKVDASYLSPHVNLSAQLEAATKQYGVPLLISEHLAHCVTPPYRRKLRRVDRVLVSGIKKPFYLYTLDLDSNCLKILQPPTNFFESPNTKNRKNMRQRRTETGTVPGGNTLLQAAATSPSRHGAGSASPSPKKRARNTASGAAVGGGAAARGGQQKISTFTGQKLSRKEEFQMRLQREETKEERLSENYVPFDEFCEDQDIRLMTEQFTAEFHHRFGMAFVNYESGEWTVARKKLEDFQKYVPEPSQEEDLAWFAKSKRLAEGTGASPSKRGAAAAQVKKVEAPVDGPSQCLLNFMKQHNYVAPADWTGYRLLSGV
ncbi:unnamed protein product [Amoebophrya sp. A120]|nr:unnamed protein product [Amoebophrya sp. A120]|eukprot:GSA120T00006653001.1